VPVVAAAVLTPAYCRPGISDGDLRSNDVSYGLHTCYRSFVNTRSYLGFNPPAAILAAPTASSVLAVAWRKLLIVRSFGVSPKVFDRYFESIAAEIVRFLRTQFYYAFH
jgi:hypothetical protein